MTSLSSTPKAVAIAVPALLIVGCALRYYAATTTPLTWHEIQVVGGAAEISLKPGAVRLQQHGASHHPPGQLYLARLGTLLIGGSILGYRFASVLLGSATCWVIFALVRRAWGLYPALCSLGLLTFNGYHIGVSSDAAERTYLFFAALAMYLFWRALEEDRPGLMIAAGTVVGVGGWVAENSYFLLPPLALYVALSRERRHWLRRWPTYAGVLLAVALYAPYVYANIRMPHEVSTLDEDYAFYGERIGSLGPSYAALALYISPLYQKYSGRISLEPVMSLACGAILLAAVLHATIRRRDELTRMLLVIFWSFFVVFSLLRSELAEFRWAAPSLFAAVPLAGRAICELVARSRVCAVVAPLPATYIVGFAVWTANMPYNRYYSPLLPPTPIRLAACRMLDGLFTGAAVHVNFAALLCDDRSPVPARYREYYTFWWLKVAALADTGWMNPALMRPVLERVEDVAPDHPGLPSLKAALARREAAPAGAGPEASVGGPIFLRSPLELLPFPPDQAERELAGMHFKYNWPTGVASPQQPEPGG